MTEAGAFFELENLLTYQNVLVMIGTWVLVVTARKTAPKFFTDGFGKRLLPLMPLVFAQALVWATIRFQPDATVGERIILGIILGAIAANGHSVLKRFGLTGLIPGLKDGDRGMGEKEDGEAILK